MIHSLVQAAELSKTLAEHGKHCKHSNVIDRQGTGLLAIEALESGARS